MAIEVKDAIANKFIRPALENPGEAAFGFGAGLLKGIADVPVMLGGAIGGTLSGRGAFQGAVDADNKIYEGIKNAYKSINPNDTDVNEKVLYGSTLAGSFVTPGKIMGKVGSKLAAIPQVGHALETVIGPGSLLGRGANALVEAKGAAIKGAAGLIPKGVTDAPVLQAVGKGLKAVGDTVKKTELGQAVEGHFNPRQAVDLINKEVPDYYQRLERSVGQGDRFLSSNDIGESLIGKKDKDLHNLVKTSFSDAPPTAQNTIYEHLKHERRFAELKTDPKLAEQALDKSIKNYSKFKGTIHEAKYFDDLATTAEAPIQAYVNKTKKALINNNIEEYEDLLKNQQNFIYGIYKKTKDVDNTVAEKLLHMGDKSEISSFLSPAVMFGKTTPAIGDAYQFLEGAQPQFLTQIRRAGFGDDVGAVLSNISSEFRTANPKIMAQEFYEPYGLTSTVATNVKDLSLQTRADLKGLQKGWNETQKFVQGLGKNDFAKLLGQAFEEVGFGEQKGVRMTIINNLNDKAVGIVKTAGFKPGTPEFNQKVVNVTREMLKGIGFIPETSVYEKGGRLAKHIDDMMKDTAQKMGGTNASSLVFFMSSWPKMAKQGMLKSFNSMNDSLHNIAKTGQASQADRLAVLEGTANILLGGLLFGARGLKAPVAVESLGAPILGFRNENTPVTQLLTPLMEWAGVDSNAKQITLDGLYNYFTGATAGAQINTPIAGVLMGSPIFASTVGGMVDTVIHAAQALAAGDPMTAAEILGDLLVSSDIERESERLATGRITNYKGEDISADLRPGAQQRGSWENAVTGTLSPQSTYKASFDKGSPFQKLDDREEAFMKLYGNMSDDEFKRKKPQFIKDLKSLSTSVDDLERVAKKLAEMRAIPSKNTAYKKFHMYGKKILNIPEDQKDLIKQIKGQFTDDDLMRSLATAVILDDETAIAAIAKIQPDIITRNKEAQVKKLKQYIFQLNDEAMARAKQNWRELNPGSPAVDEPDDIETPSQPVSDFDPILDQGAM